MKVELLPSVDMSYFYQDLELQKCPGKARTEDGAVLNGIFHRKFKKTEHTLVYVNGYLERRYTYPLIERRFSSPMVNDFNLCFVGGWIPSDQNGQWIDTSALTVKRVIEGLKPMGWVGAWKQYPHYVEELRCLAKQANKGNLATLITETEDQFRLSVCRRGKLDELFCLDLLRDDYVEFRRIMSNSSQDDDPFVVSLRETIEKMKGACLEEFINWNNEPEGGLRYCIWTGLFLGFPHETTYSLLTTQ